MSALRLVLRTALLMPLLLYGLLLAALVRVEGDRRLPRERLGAHWSRLLLRLLGITVRREGAPAQSVLMVANHVSWLDIPLIYAHAPTRFISKSEVQAWPVAGWLADGAGTFYLRRGHAGTRPLLHRLVPHLRTGGRVVLFPEGTTTEGREVRAFHGRLFSAAIEARRPVQPVALRYGTGPDGAALAPFVGEDDLLSHLLRLLRAPGLHAELHFCEPLAAAGDTRQALADRARQRIRAALDLPAADGTACEVGVVLAA